MANEFKHKDVGAILARSEWEGLDTHEADGQLANDMLYFNGTYWIRATPTQIAALLKLSELGDVNIPSPSDGDFIYWDVTEGKWKAKAMVGGYTEGARVYRSANKSIANGTETVVDFDSEDYDTDGIHDNAVDNSRLTCKTAGKYVMIAQVRFAGNNIGIRFVGIRLNGVDATRLARMGNIPCTIDPLYLIASTVYDLAVNDYIEMQVYQNSGGNLNIENDGLYSIRFSMQRIG